MIPRPNKYAKVSCSVSPTLSVVVLYPACAPFIITEYLGTCIQDGHNNIIILHIMYKDQTEQVKKGYFSKTVEF